MNNQLTLHDELISYAFSHNQDSTFTQLGKRRDHLLLRMDRLRALANQQRSKGVKNQRVQTSFCF